MARTTTEERIKRLEVMASKVAPGEQGRDALRAKVADVCALFLAEPPAAGREAFLAAFDAATAAVAAGYVETIRQVPGDVAAAGVEWLRQVVDALCARAAELLRPLPLFRER